MSDSSASLKGSAIRTDRTDPLVHLTLSQKMQLWDWRRRVSHLYAEVRALEPLEGWHRWRAGRDELFRRHPQSPLSRRVRTDFKGIEYYGYDPSFRFLVECTPPASPKPIRITVGIDGVIELRPFGRTRGLGPRLGGELTLYWIEGYGGGVFLPFQDETSDVTTYSGGRYLLDTIKGADLGWARNGLIILDFNFAYNPSCYYSDQWVCPLSPSENKIRSPISAGERISAIMTQRD